MRVVHLIAYFQPEFGFREYYYCRNLARLGVDVHVVTSDRIWPYPDLAEIARGAGIPDTRKRPAGVATMEGFRVHRLPVTFEYRDFAWVKGVRAKLAEIAPDIVHAYEGRQGMTALGARYRDELGYRLYYEHEQRWTGLSLLARLDHYLVRRHGIRSLVRKADLINVCTPAARAFLLRHFPDARGKIEFVPLGADPDFFDYRGDAEREAMREALGVREGERLVVTSGKLLRHKRHDRLLEEFFALPSAAPLALLIVGSGDPAWEETLHRRADAGARPGRRVLFEPFAPRDRLAILYSAADLGIWTTATIGAVEALACRLPLALPRTESLSHLVEAGNGVTWNEAGLGNAVGTLLDDAESLARMRRRAAEVFRERFDYRSIARIVLDRYTRLLAS
jgi:glycosyltransferase involved in cell wall biosynthesis